MTSRNIHFLIPGDPATPTGGFVYDRQAIRALDDAQRLGTVIRIDGPFPTGSAASLSACAEALAGLPDGDTVVADGLAFTALASELARVGDRLRIIALVHHPLGDETGLAPSDRDRWLGREMAALSLAETIIVTSETTRRRLGELAVDIRGVRAVPPGVDPAPDLSFRHSDTGDSLNMLCVATLIPRKAQHVLVEALSQLSDRRWQLDLVGDLRDPAYAERVRRLIEDAGLSDQIALHGAVSDAVLDGFWRRADLFVFPSLHEGWGIAPVEAVRWGLPVVTTDAGALGESVPARARRLVPADNAPALAKVLAHLLDDRQALHDLKHGALAEAADLRTWQIMRTEFANAVGAV